MLWLCPHFSWSTIAPSTLVHFCWTYFEAQQKPEWFIAKKAEPVGRLWRTWRKQRDGHMSHIPFHRKPWLELTYLPWTLRFTTTFRNLSGIDINIFIICCHSIDGCHYKYQAVVYKFKLLLCCHEVTYLLSSLYFALYQSQDWPSFGGHRICFGLVSHILPFEFVQKWCIPYTPELLLNIGEHDDQRWDRPMRFCDAETVVDWFQ